jgi:hypothetical protein
VRVRFDGSIATRYAIGELAFFGVVTHESVARAGVATCAKTYFWHRLDLAFFILIEWVSLAFGSVCGFPLAQFLDLGTHPQAHILGPYAPVRVRPGRL